MTFVFRNLSLCSYWLADINWTLFHEMWKEDGFHHIYFSLCEQINFYSGPRFITFSALLLNHLYSKHFHKRSHSHVHTNFSFPKKYTIKINILPNNQRIQQRMYCLSFVMNFQEIFGCLKLNLLLVLLAVIFATISLFMKPCIFR